MVRNCSFRHSYSRFADLFVSLSLLHCFTLLLVYYPIGVIMAAKKDPRLERAGVAGFNKPKRTPNHPTKSHVVVAKSGDQIKTIRFGQQGVSGSPKKSGESKADAARRASFKARHKANIDKGTLSAAYWANKVKW